MHLFIDLVSVITVVCSLWNEKCNWFHIWRNDDKISSVWQYVGTVEKTIDFHLIPWPQGEKYVS